ncbi:MAG TPA: bifunctional riboflavin kinase/FAD synthetase [Gammaproteobacteria bacterium]|jgi:riboflavin kinase/FMN adenylyltransferase|nr:bifunctional riboflavin kinase/FAD synthetase [Gammaproteobacteria bacterium]
MELIRGLGNLKPHHRGTVASIGNFDGVHLGHQAVLRDLKARAEAMQLPSTLVLFEPMPQEYLRPDRAPLRLTRFMEKWPRLDAAGVDRVLCLKFGRTLAEMPAEEFVQKALADGLGIRHLTVGDDFRFGKDRRGDFGLLKRAGADAGFQVADTASQQADGERVSSTRIRALLIEGKMQAAAELLGRPYGLNGRVMHGERLGRKLGFPTVNLALKRRSPPLSGIFAARVLGIPGGSRDAAAYIGKRSAAGGDHWVLEAHLPGYEGDLYGRRLEVQFLQRLREDRHFDSLDALRVQMQEDVAAAQAWLAVNVDRRKN